MMIRQLKASDVGVYYQLRCQSELEYPEYVGFNAEKELSNGVEGLSKLLDSYANEGTYVWGEFVRNQLVGVVAVSRRLSPKYHHKAFIWGMYVMPNFRGMGIAQNLMSYVVNWAKTHSELTALTLQVTNTNIRAQQFYLKLGFNVFGKEKQALYAANIYYDVNYMQFDLI